MVALVLGAGGPIGYAFHAGVLRALSDGLGWDARDADLVLGTSAGAQTGALLRAGLGAHDLFAHVTGAPQSLAGTRITRTLRWPLGRGAIGRAPLRWPSSWPYLWRALRRPWRARPGRAIAALLPEGRHDTAPLGEAFDGIYAGSWPNRALWITAVHLDSGARVVFGRHDAPRVDVGTALRCSSAVPGLRRPVEVNRSRYVDGGIASGTHVDLAADFAERPSVIVLSPLSRFGLMRLLLRAEVARLRRRGIRVLLIEPRRRTAAAMGWNPLDARLARPVAEAAYHEVLEGLRARPRREAMLALLDGRSVDADGAHHAGGFVKRAAQLPGGVEHEGERLDELGRDPEAAEQ
jgi:NTE family protein